ncbi:hypothetical protein M422DRAFT_166522 [Sphaerobolus stellatus SS14]|uniref:Metallo-beta-lactamase domain-containing protein n=1 Tax=Sphaerobolus stellatus (strain SS14) TaxID=990650 RepID=A0A0C9VT32_SPHS4|nr:hypothetical protein M422DRAFT_166522 [Sphaerobolus stellatus SS14]
MATNFEFIFHGTGSSGSIPAIGCITSKAGLENCQTCASSLTPEGRKNNRRNTGGIFRIPRSDGPDVTIVIDVGKNFLASSMDWFPKYGLRRIDAVLLTHPHADAMNGLDDLRGWTDAKQGIQTHIDIYASQESYAFVQNAFPYLISKEHASGGGFVPQFNWHIIKPDEPFVVCDIEVTPFAVHHGRLFSQPSLIPGLPILPTPESSLPSTPKLKFSSLPQAESPKHSSPLLQVPEKVAESVHPFYCLGFVILDVVYISDVSEIPPEAWRTIEKAKKRPYSLFVLDCLRPRPHPSHYGLAQAITTARRLDETGNLRTYFVGFCHDVAHEQWEQICRRVRDQEENSLAGEPEDKVVAEALGRVPSGDPVWIAPAYDGLRLFIDEEGRVREDA